MFILDVTVKEVTALPQRVGLLSREALQQLCHSSDWRNHSFRSVFCEGTSLKWTEWGGGRLWWIISCYYCTCAQEAVAIHFSDQVVFYDIYTECESKVSVVGQCTRCSLTGVAGRHWRHQIAPFWVLKLVTALEKFILLFGESNLMNGHFKLQNAQPKFGDLWNMNIINCLWFNNGFIMISSFVRFIGRRK